MFTHLVPSKPEHQHATVYEAKVCAGLIRPAVAPVVPVYHDRKDIPGSMTSSQKRYLKALGAKETDLFHDGFGLSINQASHLIDALKKGAPVETPIQPPVEDSRLTMLKGLFSVVPTGYFAVQGEESLVFIRVSQPKSGVYKGTTKIQTQHSDDLIDRVWIWPSGQWKVKSPWIIDVLMVLVVDYQTAAMRYAHEIGKCMRCNKALTDERSRHYGIGPDCEQVWTWVIPTVDEQRGYHWTGAKY